MSSSFALPTPLQNFQAVGKYARWREDLGRRELWPETVRRYRDFFEPRSTDALSSRRWNELESSIVNLDAIPSMRALWTAGPAAEKDEVAIYNCSYLTLSRPEAWDEAMYMLMCGVGVGYSVERHHVEKLPGVPTVLHPVDDVIVVADSKVGWASSYRRLIKMLYAGFVPKYDLTRIRPAGAILNTFGGRASGPEPLDRLMRFTIKTFNDAAGRQLTTREAHEIMCMVADIVVVGGVRRSSLISLFSEDDFEILNAKTGNWFDTHPHLGMSNNTQVTHGRPPLGKLMHTFASMVSSGYGEPGICNREALQRQAARFGRRDPSIEYGMNPCGEIILRDRQLCNLSAAVARPSDTLDDLKRKYGYAVDFGTVQAGMTDFRYLSAQWKRNCEEERLLGASLDGIPDHPVLNGSQGRDERDRWQRELRDHGRRVAERTAEKLQIAIPAAIGALKPAGNSSVLHGAPSPLKPHHAPFYLRRTRINKNDPVYHFLSAVGVPMEDEVAHPDTTAVIAWPVKAPEGARTAHDWDAVESLEQWLSWQENFCEHKPSVTINYTDDEVPDLFKFVAEHYDKMAGVAFLATDDHKYVQAPYEEVDEATYWDAVSAFPEEIDWSLIGLFENDDQTTAARELACVSGVCTIP